VERRALLCAFRLLFDHRIVAQRLRQCKQLIGKGISGWPAFSRARGEEARWIEDSRGRGKKLSFRNYSPGCVNRSKNFSTAVLPSAICLSRAAGVWFCAKITLKPANSG
jgi:hypothetical protein